MAKKFLCVVLSIVMLMSTLVIASSAAQYDWYNYTVEEAEEEVATKWWYVDYDSSVDYKDLINRTFLTGTQFERPNVPTVAAAPEVLERNLFFWEDEIIEAYNDPAATNEDYCDLYNKMKTPMICTYTYEEDGETIVEADVLYDTAYIYRAEWKGKADVTLVADKQYVKPGDTVTVDFYIKTNFITMQMAGGFFYDKTMLTPTSIVFDEETQAGWYMAAAAFDQAYRGPDGELYLNKDGTLVDRRKAFWPKSLQEDPANFDKYASAYILGMADVGAGEGNYIYAKELDGSRMFSTTFVVGEDVPEGTVLEFFMPKDCTLDAKTEILEQEMMDRYKTFQFMRMSLDGGTAATNCFSTDMLYKYNHDVTVTPLYVTVGEEPAPTVKGEVLEATTTPGTIGENVPVDVTVTGSPDSIRLATADGAATTYTRDDATIVATDAGEVWTIDVFADDAETTYDVYASYGDLGWTEEAVQVTVTAVKAEDLKVHSIKVDDMYPDAQSGGVILAGKHDVIIETSTDVVKVQFMAADGGTYTYGSIIPGAENPYVDKDGVRTWTISHYFGPYGENTFNIRTRSMSTFFAASGTTLDATVVY